MADTYEIWATQNDQEHPTSKEQSQMVGTIVVLTEVQYTGSEPDSIEVFIPDVVNDPLTQGV